MKGRVYSDSPHGVGLTLGVEGRPRVVEYDQTHTAPGVRRYPTRPGYLGRADDQGLDAVVNQGPGLDAVVDRGPGVDAVVDQGPSLDAVVDQGLGVDAVRVQGPGLGLDAVVREGPGLDAVVHDRYY